MVSEKYEVVEETAKSGHSIYVVNHYYLHSKYDPVKEARRIAEKHYKKHYLHILFGYGAGYIAEGITDKISENEQLIIVEPIEQFVRLNKIKLDNTIIINDIQNANINKILAPLVNKFQNRIKVICSPNYDKLFPALYKRLLSILRDNIYIQKVNENTIKMFSKEWQQNFISNLFYAFQDIPLHELKRYFNFPVVVASGGPSLTKQIPLLKQVRENILLISSGSTINTLLHYNIEPDFVVSIDGGFYNYQHFKTLKFSKAKVIYSLTHNKDILQEVNQKSFYFVSNTFSRLQSYAEKLLGERVSSILDGASVAICAFNIAQLISNGPIALIGQDLAYTNNQTHAEHNKHFRELDDAYIKHRGMFYTEGYNGDSVLTDYSFFTMKNDFEILVKDLADPQRFFNCTEGGIRIEGFQQVSFKEFCDKFVDAKKVVSLYKMDEFPQKNIQDWKEFLARIEDEIDLYRKVHRLVQEAVIELKKNASDISFDPKTIKKLDSIDQKLKPIFEQGVLGIITQPIIIDTLNNYLPKRDESQPEKYKRIYARSLELYSRLQEVTLDSLNYFVNLKDKTKNKINSIENEGK